MASSTLDPGDNKYSLTFLVINDGLPSSARTVIEWLSIAIFKKPLFAVLAIDHTCVSLGHITIVGLNTPFTVNFTFLEVTLFAEIIVGVVALGSNSIPLNTRRRLRQLRYLGNLETPPSMTKVPYSPRQSISLE